MAQKFWVFFFFVLSFVFPLVSFFLANFEAHFVSKTRQIVFANFFCNSGLRCHNATHRAMLPGLDCSCCIHSLRSKHMFAFVLLQKNSTTWMLLTILGQTWSANKITCRLKNRKSCLCSLSARYHLQFCPSAILFKGNLRQSRQKRMV